MFRTIGVVCALVVGLALASCCMQDDDDKDKGWWEDAERTADQPGDGQPFTVEEIRSYYEGQSSLVRSGLMDGLVRFLSALEGGEDGGIEVTPLGGDRFDVTANLDLDGNSSQETSTEVRATFSGDPTDGIGEDDLPVTVTFTEQDSPAGTATSTLTIALIGTSEYLVEGHSTVRRGDTLEENEFSYTVSLLFPNIPIYGWECIELTRGGAYHASYEVTYDYGGDGHQYIFVEGDIDGIPFQFDWGVPPT